MNKRKAQLQTQIFMYLFIAIVVTLTFILGYRFIKGIKEGGESISLNMFQKELEKSIKAVSYTYGEVNLIELELSKEYKEVCFVDSNKAKALENADINNIDDYPLIKNAVESDIKENVFLVVSKSKDVHFDISNIEVDKGFLCINNPGVLKIRLEGLGNRTRILPQ